MLEENKDETQIGKTKQHKTNGYQDPILNRLTGTYEDEVMVSAYKSFLYDPDVKLHVIWSHWIKPAILFHIIPHPVFIAIMVPLRHLSLFRTPSLIPLFIFLASIPVSQCLIWSFPCTYSRLTLWKFTTVHFYIIHVNTLRKFLDMILQNEALHLFYLLHKV